MPKSDALYELIHSLSKSEKRYFKLFCTRESSGGNYLRLFNAIEKQKQYDEPAIKKAFRTETFVRQLHVTKNYLRQLILKSLRNYHAHISKDAELKDVLRNIEILYNKELYRQCSAELRKADSIARKHELLTGSVEIETWRRKLAQTFQPHGYTIFKETLVAQRAAIDALSGTNDHWHLAVNVSSGMFNQQGNVAVRNVSLKNAGKAQTLEAKALHFNTQYLLDLQNNDHLAAESRLTELITLLEEHPERIAEEPGLYVSSINNLLSFLVFQKRHDEGFLLIQKAKSVYEKWKITASNRTLLKQILRTYNIELEIYRASKSWQHGSGFIIRTEEFIENNEHKIPKDYLVSFWFQLASIHFMRKQFGRSLEWVGRILNTRYKGVRTDLQVQAQILNLMIHLEQQNLMVLRYFADSLRRYIKKANYVYPYIEVLLKFIIKIANLPLLEYKQAFLELKKSLFPEEKENLIPEQHRNYIDYHEWIIGKVGQ
jgi:hypothetical protein